MKTLRYFFLVNFLIIFLIAAIPLSINGYINYRTVNETMAPGAEQRLTHEVERLAIYMDTWIEMNLKMLRQNASLDDMISMRAEKQKPILQSIFSEYGKWMYGVNTLATDGREIVRHDNQPLLNYADRRWFQDALIKPYGTEVIASRTTGRPSWALAIPIKKKDKTVGILQFSSFISNLSDLVTEVKIGKTGYAFLLSSQGKVIAHPKVTYTQIMADLSQHPAFVEPNNQSLKRALFIDEQTKKQSIAFAKRTNYDLVVVVQQDYAEASTPVIEANQKVLLTLGGFLFVVSLISLFIANYLNQRRKNAETNRVPFSYFLKLLAVMLIMASVPLAINWAIDNNYFKDHFAKDAEQRLSLKSEALVSYVDTWVEMNLKMLRQNASLEDIKSMDPKRQKPVLAAIVKEYPWHWNSYVVEPGGQQVARSDNEPLKNFSDRAWLKKILDGGPVGNDVVIGRSTGKPTWALAVPIINDQKKLVGVIGIGAVLSDLSTAIENVKIGKTGYAYLVTDKGKLIVHQRKELVQGLLDFNKHPSLVGLGNENKKKIAFIDNELNKAILSYAQKTKHGWVIMVQQELSEAINTTKLKYRERLMLLITGLIAASLIAWIVSYRFKI